MQHDAFAPGSHKAHLNGGIRQWAIYVSMLKWPPCLINASDQIPLHEDDRSERRAPRISPSFAALPPEFTY